MWTRRARCGAERVLNLLPLTFVLPILGFLALTFLGSRLPERAAAAIGVGSVAASAIVTALVGWDFLTHPPEGGFHTTSLWTWMHVGDFAATFALRLDALSLTMLGVVAGVGFFIHLYASCYRHDDDGYARFFSYMNLFVASMLFLVLADDLLFLYFGWEGVGLCSYLLIGFLYKDSAKCRAARQG